MHDDQIGNDKVPGIIKLLHRKEAWRDAWEELSESEQSVVLSLIETSPYSIGPSKGPQTMAYASQAETVGYGGAAGGGKSALIAMLALQKHQKVVIFRRDAKQIRDIVGQLVRFVGHDVGLNRNDNVFRLTDFPGHEIEWGGVGEPEAWGSWRGREHDLLCFDEVTEIDEHVVDNLMGWLRSPDVEKVPAGRCRAIMTFNPPGAADAYSGSRGRWVVDYFAPWIDSRFKDANPDLAANAGEIRYAWNDSDDKTQWSKTDDPVTLFEGTADEVVVEKMGRTFIPAFCDDNPFKDSKYKSRLAAMKEPMRSQLLQGKFSDDIMDSENQIIPTKWVDDAMNRWTPEGKRGSMNSMGVDVSRGGKDATVLSRRHGFWFDNLIRIPGKLVPTGSDVVGHITKHMGRDAPLICIDVGNVGSSPFDILDTGGVNVVGILAQSKSFPPQIHLMEAKQKFVNVRSALWWLLKKMLDPDNGFDVALPKDNQLRKELITPLWKFAINNAYQVEAKVDIKTRLHMSPDSADALTYSLYNIFEMDDAQRILSRKPAKVDINKLTGRHDPNGWNTIPSARGNPAHRRVSGWMAT